MVIVTEAGSYESTEKFARNLVKEIVQSKKGKNAILALELGNIIQMVYEKYDTRKDLLDQVIKYQRMNFIVHYSAAKLKIEGD